VLYTVDPLLRGFGGILPGVMIALSEISSLRIIF
jgi:hypothetical protein